MDIALAEIYRSIRKSVDWLLYTREHLHLRQRDIDMDALRLRKTVTSAEIFRADFGTACPNGLAIAAYPAQSARLFSLEDQEGFRGWSREEQQTELRRTGGRAGEDDRIYLHPEYLAKAPVENIFSRKAVHALANIFAHEHIHRRQGVERDLGLPSAMGNLNMAPLLAPADEPGIAGLAKRLYRQFNRAALDRRATKKYEFNIKDYFSNEEEVQARMHEVLAQGYAGWQRMPVTKAGLQAAFVNLGLRCPSSILRELRESEEGRQALKDFRCSPAMRHQVRHTIAQINFAQDYTVFGDRKEQFWQRALPAMYGNLLELWGDGPGRARMGLGRNPVQVRELLLAMDDKAVPVKKLGEMVDALAPEDANGVMAALVHNRKGVLDDRAHAVVDRLFARDEARRAMLEADEFDLAKPGQPGPGWWLAMNSGRKDILGKYIDAGFDPSRMVCFTDGKGAGPRTLNLLDNVRQLAHFEDILAGREDAPKGLQKVFVGAAARERQRAFIEKQKDMLGFLARCSEDPDRKLTFTSAGGAEQASLNDLLSIAGLEPVKPLPAMGGAPQRGPGNASVTHL